jgi:hypothetical protein
MKNIHAILLRVFILAVSLFIPGRSQAQAGGYAVTERGADYAVHQKTTVEHGTNRVHQYVELATGLNYTNSSGQLVPSKEEIDVLPNGGAAAVQGRHKVYFPGDLSSGVIEVVTPDGPHLKSRPLGLFYDDGTNTVLIAQLTNSIGVLAASNQVVYPGAFMGLDADVRYTYRKGGFEQDIVLREQPPAPESFGLSSQNSRLQVLTEFFNAPEPKQSKVKTSPKAKAGRQNKLSDTTLVFGQMKMVRGSAFAINPEGGKRKAQTSAVSKSWVHLAGRTFLVEELRVTSIAAQLQELPVSTSATVSSASPPLHKPSATRWLPSVQMAQAGTNSLRLAKADLSRQPGVVLDYDVVDTDQTDFTFESGTTYYISSAVNFDGTVTFEGGSVLKFDSDSSVSLTLNTADIVCPASPGSPAIFTAKDDDSIGDVISGSTGNPNGYYYGGGLSLAVEDEMEYNISNLVFSYQNTGIILNFSTLALFNVQTHFCNTFLEYSEGIVDFQNCLFDNTEMVLSCADTVTGFTFLVQSMS